MSKFTDLPFGTGAGRSLILTCGNLVSDEKVIFIMSSAQGNIFCGHCFGQTEIKWQSYIRTSDFGYVDAFLDTVANHSVEIPNGPVASNYIPVVVGHNNTNECIEHIFWEGDKWRIYSTVEQSVGIRFYKYPM